MRARRPTIAIFLFAFAVGAGCSSESRNVLDDACEVVVSQCGDLPSRTRCIDFFGDQPNDCLSCIVDRGCDYSSQCPRAVVGCRFRAVSDGG